MQSVSSHHVFPIFFPPPDMFATSTFIVHLVSIKIRICDIFVQKSLTSCNVSNNFSGARCSPALDESDIEMQTDQAAPSNNVPESMSVNVVPSEHQGGEEQSVNNSMANVSSKNLR